MKVLIDTNVLVSAFLHPGSTPYKAFYKAVTWPHSGILCDQNVDELRRIFNRKFPEKVGAMETFLSLALMTLDLVPVPVLEADDEGKVRDVKDRPILRAAIYAGADILLTGDKDFLDAGIVYPKCLSPAEFLLLDSQKQ